MLSEFFKIPIRIQEAASFSIYQIPTWAAWNLFEELLRWFYRFEFSALINLVLSRPVSSQVYTQLFTLCPVCSARARARSLRKLKLGMSTLLSIFGKQHRKKNSLYQSLKVIISKIKMSLSKVLWSVCEEFAIFDREFLDFAISNEVSLTNKMFRK